MATLLEKMLKSANLLVENSENCSCLPSLKKWVGYSLGVKKCLSVYKNYGVYTGISSHYVYST
jgi:hypothetical protein